MARKNRFVLVLLAAAAVTPWLIVAGGPLMAQSRPAPRQPAYQYVGVDRTIARVETATGRVEILTRKGETRASLLMPDRRPWRWREVRIDDQSHERPIRRDISPGQPADDVPESDGYDDAGGG